MFNLEVSDQWKYGLDDTRIVASQFESLHPVMRITLNYRHKALLSVGFLVFSHVIP